jgi:hypothetical protein
MGGSGKDTDFMRYLDAMVLPLVQNRECTMADFRERQRMNSLLSDARKRASMAVIDVDAEADDDVEEMVAEGLPRLSSRPNKRPALDAAMAQAFAQAQEEREDGAFHDHGAAEAAAAAAGDDTQEREDPTAVRWIPGGLQSRQQIIEEFGQPAPQAMCFGCAYNIVDANRRHVTIYNEELNELFELPRKYFTLVKVTFKRADARFTGTWAKHAPKPLSRPWRPNTPN